MGDSGTSYMVVWDDFVGEALKGTANLNVTTFVALKPGATDTPAGTRNFMELLAGDPKFDREATQGDDTAESLYTSRTTRQPKSAGLTHLHPFIQAHLASHRVGHPPADVTLPL